MAALAYSLTGDGPALLVLLHGLTGDRASVLRYAPTGDIAVLAIDLPGHGASAPAEEFTLPVVTQAVAAVVRSVQRPSQKVHVAGVSLGAAVAAELAAQEAVLVASAIFIRPAHTGSPNPPHLALNLVVADLLDEDYEAAAARLTDSADFVRVRAASPSAALNLERKARAASAVEARRRGGARPFSALGRHGQPRSSPPRRPPSCCRRPTTHSTPRTSRPCGPAP